MKRREWEVLAAADFENPSENAACEVGIFIGWRLLDDDFCSRVVGDEQLTS